MKNPRSLIVCFLALMVFLAFRLYYSDIGPARQQLVITRWDAFGYYLYLPASIIYQDIRHLKWADSIDRIYNVTGGDGMPVQQLQNGNVVCKYLGGVAILQAPFFGIGHLIASLSGLPTDGFSPPYQYALAFGVILYCFLSLLLLRKILLRFFDDTTAAWSLLLLTLATNLLQYVSKDSGLSHGWIFSLYVLLLYTTIRWHEQPHWKWAFATGFVLGWATICRPTEAVALFIPLLWSTQNREVSHAKWALVRAHRAHIFLAIAGGIAGILPQLVYWKLVTGDFIYDVGSKWFFLSPWFRVLFGFEKGWFIYTPVAILFVAGLFFIRKFPFRNAVLVYCLLTIWIVIAWEDWQYGASYSTRALVQSYPVFAFPLAALVSRTRSLKWRPVLYLVGLYLIFVNLFQVVQYNSTVLHFRDMNRRYYARIYLNPDPTPIDMSLLDGKDLIRNESNYEQSDFAGSIQPAYLQFPANEKAVLLDTILNIPPNTAEAWLRVDADIHAPDRLWKSQLVLELQSGDSVLRRFVRLYNPVGEKTGCYAFYAVVPEAFYQSRMQLFVGSEFDFSGDVRTFKLKRLIKPGK